jgi:putative transposase
MRYRRAWMPGGSFFFTVALADRTRRTLVERIDALRAAVRRVRARRPFAVVAWVVLPDHLHAVWTLPPGDADFATRWALIKGAFARCVPAVEDGGRGRRERGERGLWQKRYWEHRVRDEEDLARCVDYVHFNPVKHGHAARAADWPYSTIHVWIRRGWTDADWGVDPRGGCGDPGIFGED